MYKIIDGKALAEEAIGDVQRKISAAGIEPGLAVILVGNDPASRLYVKLKEQACKRVGIFFHKYLIDESAPESEVLETIKFLNADPGVDAILIQVPLPKKFDQAKIIEALDYRKDVDGFHRRNMESLLSGKPQHILPGLALGIWNLIASCGEEHYKNKQAVIISKSDEFSKPLAKLLDQRGIASAIIKPDDQKLSAQASRADILITAVGRPDFITAEMVKDGAVVIDVGINKKNSQTVGDVDFADVAPKTSFITPVPGGVGPMTVAMLLYNTWLLAKGHHQNQSK